MTGTTNVPAISWGTAGPLAPSGPAVLAGRQQDYNVSFNVSFNWTGVTPQGQLASSDAAIIANAYNLVVYYANQVDPNYAQGRMQDAIGQIYFLPRNPAIPTQLTVNCTGGGAGTSVQLKGLDLFTSGLATIQDNAGNLYQLLNTITLPSGGGTVQGTFACTLTGPISVPSGSTPISIYQQITGWDSVALVSGVQGVNTESRAAFEQRRHDSVAGNSAGAIGSIIGAVSKVPGVVDYFGYNNNTSAPVTIGGVSIAAYSIYICVAGGAQTAVGQAIFNKKGPGAPTVGNTAVTAYDSNPLYAAPIAYTINYQIPTTLLLTFSVTLVESGQIPSNATTLVQNAIVAAATQGVISPASVFTASISGNVLNVSAVGQGVLAVGQVLADTTDALAGGTQITDLLSGTGGVGTYRVSVPQTVASETMSGTTNASQIVPNLRARIGQVVYASTYTQAVNALGSWAQVASIEIGSANTSGAVITGSITGSTLTVGGVTSGTVAIGQFLTDAAGHIIPGTQITAGSGSSWTVNNAQTVTSETITCSAPNQTDVIILANQVPSIIASGVVVGVT
jgi:hypothetical protein